MTIQQQFGVSLEELKASDVMGKQPDKDAQELEKKIKNARKGSTLQIKLTADELTRLQNEAIRAGFEDDWKAYATRRFKEEVTGGLIGQATVGTFKKVTAPTNRYGQ